MNFILIILNIIKIINEQFMMKFIFIFRKRINLIYIKNRNKWQFFDRVGGREWFYIL